MLLISNSFPFSLIRRKVVVEPHSVEDLLAVMQERPWVSTWGHANTVELASTMLCADLRPKVERPALRLSPDNLPLFEGRTFNECWILSPDYTENFRPKVGEEVTLDKIKAWQVLRMEWKEENSNQNPQS